MVDPTSGIGEMLRAAVPYLPPLNGERVRLALGQWGESLTIKRLWRDRHGRIHADITIARADGRSLWMGALVLSDHRDRLTLDDVLTDLGLERAAPVHVLALAERLETLVDTMADLSSGAEKVSAHLKSGVWAETESLPWQTAQEIGLRATAATDWLVYPWLVAGTITEVDAFMKAGKTTLVMAMCASILGRRRFLDGVTQHSPIVYLTEQLEPTFKEALRRADLLDSPDLHVLYHTDARHLTWPEIMAASIAKAAAVGARILIVDTLSQFAGLRGEAENSSGGAFEAMEPLQQAAAAGLGVLVVRHERKSGGDVGHSGRGSSAFGGVADIVVQLKRPEGNTRPTIRLLVALSRFDETPTTLAVELQETGDYLAIGEESAVVTSQATAALLAAAPAAAPGLTLSELLSLSVTTSRATAQRVLDSLVADGRLTKTGEGKRSNPHRWHRPPRSPEIVSAQTPILRWAETNDTVADPCAGCGEPAGYTTADGRRLCLTCITSGQ